MKSEELDGGLEAAYRKKARGDSILATIERLTGAVPRVFLRDDSTLPSPLVKPADGPDSDRYQVIGEIGRGGVGVVLKGRDIDLGRDVAMKVLRDDFAGNPEVIQRFVEEAQIGGQLQHPGIVPVYELGLNAHKQPFFTMKLVKGETLSALLTKRATAQEGRRRFLRIFEQVCETMAYAHTRGVIHRDLKPSNIMVGAFGEVQIVDWGFAKILRRGGVDDERRAKEAAPTTTVVETIRSGSVGSESCAGSVMGTPAYMPPEQALGEIDKLDERSDVFALGALLCEILTGRPPYGEGDDSALVQAAEARLDGAHARLDNCGADADLVQITKRCLAPAPAVRYKDAGEVVEVISGHLAAVEERAQKADRAAAVAKAKAAEEAKRRRLTVALAAALVCAVVATASGLYWVDKEQRFSRELALVPVADAKDAALLAHGEARADLSKWGDALEAAKHHLASAEATEGADVDQARMLVSKVRRDREAAEQAAAAAAKDQRLVSRLEEIYTWRGEDFPDDARAQAYDKALSGIDAESMRASPAKAEIVAALDDWEKFDLASEVDPDPWCIKVRVAEIESLKKLVKDEREPRDLLLLAARLERGGETEAARELLLRAHKVAPKDFRIAFALGAASETNDAPRYFQIASLLRSGRIGTDYGWGVSMLEAKDMRSATPLLESVYERDSEFGKIRLRLAKATQMLGSSDMNAGRLDVAKTQFRRALELDPDNEKASIQLGWILFRTSIEKPDVDDAIEAFRNAVRLNPEHPQWRQMLLSHLQGAKRGEEAVQMAQERLESLSESGTNAARSMCLAQLADSYRSIDRNDDAIRSLRLALKTNGGEPAYQDLFKIARMYFEKGDYAAAAQVTREAIKSSAAQRRLSAYYYDLLVMSFRKVGRASEAAAAIEECRRRYEEMAVNWSWKAQLAWWLARSPHPGAQDGERALELIREVEKEGDKANPICVVAKALVNVRYGNPADSVDWLEASMKGYGPTHVTGAQHRCVLAMALWSVGRKDDAREQLGIVRKFMTTWKVYASELALHDAYRRAREMIGE
ncbi:MAG: protein kinase [Planctomycetota bacterium]